MSVTLLASAGNLKKFRNANWPSQQTYRIPFADLPNFVSAVLGVYPITSGTLTINEVVFGAAQLGQFLARYDIELPSMRNTRSLHGWSVVVTETDELSVLLQVAFKDQIDFLFVPQPRHYAIYSDHDEFATFFAVKRGHLASVAKALAANAVSAIPDYKRRVN